MPTPDRNTPPPPPSGVTFTDTPPPPPSGVRFVDQSPALKPPTASSVWGKTADDYSRQIANGMLFGFGDNLEAAMVSLPLIGGGREPNESFGQAYRRNLAQTRDSIKDFQADNPKTAVALDLAGAIIPALATGGGSATVAGARMLPRVLRGAAYGAAYGGLGNAGNSNAPTIGSTFEEGLKGALFGGVTGGAMPVVSAGMRRVAGDIADSALGIGMKDRRYGKTPATAILDETSGLRASTIEQSAQDRMNQLQAEMTAAGQGQQVNIGGAQAFAEQLANDEARGINQPLAGELQEMAQALTNAPANFHGATLPALPTPQISPMQSVLDTQRLKRDFSNRFVAWNSARPATVSQAGKRVYNQLDHALDAAVPEAAQLNQRISSLIPVVQRAEAKQLQAGAGQRVMHRIAAHTGALSGGLAGYHYGGIPGAIAGLVLPEVLASTPAEMTVARLLDYPSKAPDAAEAFTRYVLSQGTRLLPRSNSQEEDYK